jgi:hypothetical protein
MGTGKQYCWSIWKQVQQQHETVLVHDRPPPGRARVAQKPYVVNAVQVATVESTQRSNAVCTFLPGEKAWLLLKEGTRF